VTDPKFLAKFVKQVTVIRTDRSNKYQEPIAENNKEYKFIQWSSQCYRVGDMVLLAKLRHTHHAGCYVWDVYEVILPIYEFLYNYRMSKSYVIPQTWFGHTTYMIKEVN